MRIFRHVLLVLLFFGSISAAGAAGAPADRGATIRRTVVDIPNRNCEKTGTCDLKRVLFITEDYRVGKEGAPDAHYGTKFYALYETTTPAALEKYVFVQFARGCMFSSYRDPKTGAVVVNHDIVLKNFGEYIIWRIPNWIIDAPRADPVYFTAEGFPRHFFYAWQKDTFSVPDDDSKLEFYGILKDERSKSLATQPRLFVMDAPSQAFVTDSGRAHNTALEYKMCLFRAGDVPQKATRKSRDLGTPIQCGNWQSTFVYNHDLKKFESPQNTVLQCDGKLETLDEYLREYERELKKQQR